MTEPHNTGVLLFAGAHEWGPKEAGSEAPWAATRLERDGDSYGLYQVEVSDEALGFTVSLLDGPGQRNDWFGDQVNFWVLCDTSREGGPGFVILGAQLLPKNAAAVPLSRETALEHPRVHDLWKVIDWLAEADPMMHFVRATGALPTAESWRAWALVNLD